MRKLVPGRKIVYTGDIRPSRGLIRFAENADLLIHDVTFDDELWERAREDGHSTPSQAAEAAKEAKAKWLILVHIGGGTSLPASCLNKQGKFSPTQMWLKTL